MLEKKRGKQNFPLPVTIVIFTILLFVSLLVINATTLEQIIHPPVDAGDGRTPLYFSLIQSRSGQYISAYSLVGLELALDLINNDSTLLPGYSLHYVFTDAPCDKRDALNAFHHQLFKAPTKIGIIGSGCSVSTEPTATISHYYNLVQVSCIASSPAFRNRNIFPRYFQLLPTEASLATAYYAIIKHYNWRRVALIVQDENIFTVAIDELKGFLVSSGVEYSEKKLVIGENSKVDGLSSTFDEDSRIFLVSTYEPIAQQIICEAYRQGYKYPRYVFFTISWYTENWWRLKPDEYDCTVEQREEVLESTMSLLILPYARYLDATQQTETGERLTVSDYFRLASEYVNRPPLHLDHYDDLSPVCYDAMWTFALALKNTIAEFESNSTLSDMANELVENATLRTSTFRLENFSYRNNIVMETMFKHLEKTNFLGVSGNVSFDGEGIRYVTQFIIFQFRKNPNRILESTVVGRVTPNSRVQYENGESDSSIWPLGIPYDGSSVNEEVLSVHVALTVLLIILSCVGIVFSIICLIFNFYFREQTLVQLTSPNLNYLIGSGAILLYFAIIVTVLPAKSAVFAGVLCNLQVWLTGFGYSLCYGTILVKMWRVYYIFSNPTAQKKRKMHDWMLGLMVLCFVVIDVVMLVVFSAVEGVQGELGAYRELDKENGAIMEGDQGRIREFYVYICDSRARNIFLGIFYGYKTSLQVVGLFLAFATRKVKIKGIDDAKWVAATIYITSIVLVITILATNTLNELNNTYAAVFSSGLFIGTTFIMAFVFVSKMYAVYKDPTGKSVFNKSRPTESTSKGKESSS